MKVESWSGMSIGKSIGKGMALFAIVFAGAYGAMVWFNQTKGTEKPLIVYKSDPGANLAVQNAGALPDFRSAVQKILPSVVSIDTLVQGENWFGEQVIEPTGSGSGVVLSQNGYIVTNNHVVTNGGRRVADRIIVKFKDGTSEEATIVGRDPRSDLAVLKVNRNDLTPVTVGDSAKLEVGEWTIAAGNPLGFEHTISVGVVSSIGRPLQSSDSAIFVDGIQTDAAINQGNSGGALCDSEGRLIGINTMIATTDQGSIGIGFAIPANRVRAVVDDIIKFGRARYGRVGVSVRRDSSILTIPRARQQLMEIVGTTTEPPEEGVLVQQVFDGGPAARAGLKPLDIILSIDGKETKETRDYQVIMANKKPGDQIKLKVWSAGQAKDLTVTLDDAGGA